MADRSKCPHNATLLNKDQQQRYREGRAIYCPNCHEQMRLHTIKTEILAALRNPKGDYWVNWMRNRVPLSEINKYYAQNIRHKIRTRLKPEQYEDSPLYMALGRIRRHG